jgi:hypothetical protein
MTTAEFLGFLFSFVTTAVGVTWFLSRALGAIKEAVAGHVAEDKAEHRALDARVVKLEGRKPRR